MSNVLYCVEIELEAIRAGDYRRWLALHVAEITALPGVLGARWFERVDPLDPHRCGFRCDYRFVSKDALGLYLADHAPRLRADAEHHFGGQFSAKRSVYTQLGQLGSDA